jgi:SAM-dependent methyltransferase
MIPTRRSCGDRDLCQGSPAEEPEGVQSSELDQRIEMLKLSIGGRGFLTASQHREKFMSSSTAADETYQHGHHASVVANHATRTADRDAAFFLPSLRPGMRLLDVGCGPGSITCGLAQRVAPAETIGIDASTSVIETASALARKNAIENVMFEVGNHPARPPEIRLWLATSRRLDCRKKQCSDGG